MPASRKNWGDLFDPERPFSSALRNAIAHSQLSAYEIERRIEIPRSAITRFLAGERGLELANLDKIFACLSLQDLGGSFLATLPEEDWGGRIDGLRRAEVIDPDDFHRPVSAALRMAVDASLLEPKELAGQSGIPFTTLWRFMHGGGGLAVDTIDQLVKVIGAENYGSILRGWIMCTYPRPSE